MMISSLDHMLCTVMSKRYLADGPSGLGLASSGGGFAGGDAASDMVIDYEKQGRKVSPQILAIPERPVQWILKS